MPKEADNILRHHLPGVLNARWGCGLTEGEIQSLVTEVVTPQEASSPTKPLQKALVQLGPS